MFKVAIVGRANVGKTTLFNRMVGKKIAIVHHTAGITRDRKSANIDFFGLQIQITDTAGIEDLHGAVHDSSDRLSHKMISQSLYAVDEADVCFLVVDGLSGITAQDRAVSDILRQKQKKVVLLVNKTENHNKVLLEQDLFLLGGDAEMILISAEQSMGLDAIYDFLRRQMEHSPHLHSIAQDHEQDIDEKPISIAIVGRPNVGKSTLINKILGYDRLITDAVAGTTRDAIAIPCFHRDTKLKIVDTAGMRKKSNVCDIIEKTAVLESLHAIDFAHVVILLIDINTPFDHQDQIIISRITEMGRAPIVAFNKSDTVKPSAMNQMVQYLKNVIVREMPDTYGGDFFTLSALYDKDISAFLDEVLIRYHKWRSKISTAKLNNWLRNVIANGALCAKIQGKKLKMKFITQVASSPPTFAIFVNFVEVPDNYTQFLRKSLAEHCALQGIPIRFIFKKSRNPFLKGDAENNSPQSLRRRHNK